MSLTTLLKGLIGGRQEIQLKTPIKPVHHQVISNPWHAVGVVPGANACAIACGETGTRHLSKDAPPLPLQGCDAATCTCRYRHFDDRRGALRRSADVWSNRGSWAGQERRRGGRRSTDMI